MGHPLSIAIVWRGTAEERRTATRDSNRLRHVFAALAERGVDARPAVYTDALVDEVRQQLLAVDGVLVWVNPIAEGADRSALDPMLREVAAKGVWVSTHPDVIMKMGTKETIFRTQHLGWGSECFIYGDHRELCEQLPARLASGGARVLKQNRGNGGDGVWKVMLVGPSAIGVRPATDTVVEVQHALRGSVPERLALGAFLDRCRSYFAGDGRMIDQAFQSRLPEGMIRCYMVQERVVGFGHQLIKALLPPPAEGPASEAAQPGPRIMSGASNPAFQVLRRNMEFEWVPAMRRLLQIEREALPAIWDADFLYGPKTASGDDSYVLCEINVSCVFPFPDEALGALADAAVKNAHAAGAVRALAVPSARR
jgi:hypothetical protein